MKTKLSLIIIFLFACSCSFATYHKIGHYQTDGRVVSVDYDGEYLYSAKYLGLIEILNVDNPESPELVGSFQLSDHIPGVVGKIAVFDTLAFITGSAEIHVLNIKNPDNITYVTGLGHGDASCVICDDNRLYIADDKLYILDISDIYSSQEISNLSCDIFMMCMFDDIIYAVNSGGYEFSLIDVQDEENPEIINSMNPLAGQYSNIKYKDGFVYLTGNAGLISIDVRIPDDISISDQEDINHTNYGISIMGDKAVVTSSQAGIVVVDISNPEMMSTVGFFDTNNYASHVIAADNIAYVDQGYGGIAVIDINNPFTELELDSIMSTSEAHGCIVSDETVFLANGIDGLDILNLSEENVFTYLGTYFNRIGTGSHITLNDTKLCFSWTYQYPEILFIDVSDPNNPDWVGYLDMTEYTLMGKIPMWQTSTHLFAGAGTNLLVVDINDFANPEIVMNYETGKDIRDVIIEGDKAYLACGDAGVQIIDIENLSSPQKIGEVGTSDESNTLIMHSDHLFVSDGFAGLKIIDVSDPLNPIICDSIIPRQYSELVVKPIISNNQIVFFDSQWNELILYDITDPCNIIEINSYQINKEIFQMIFHNDKILGSVYDYGLTIIDIPDFVSGIDNEYQSGERDFSMKVYPNPCRNLMNIDLKLNKKTYVIGRVINQNGVVIRELLNRSVPSGLELITWDGTDEHGRKVNDGIYVVQFLCDDKILSRKVINN